MITIPFANVLGPSSGPAADGVIYGALPKVAPGSALSEAHLAPLTTVYRGNVDALGGVAWTDVTAAANNDTAGDVALFDTSNPAADLLCVELSVGDEINGISLLIVNGSTGKIGSVNIPANQPITKATMALPAAKGDQMLIVHAFGTANLGDGAIFVS